MYCISRFTDSNSISIFVDNIITVCILNCIYFYNTRDVWKQTSYNTKAGVHLNGGTPFRKNYAGVGYSYDPQRDAFIEPKPFNSWILNETTCLWEAPIAYPDDGQNYNWNEDTQQWDLNE